MRKIYCWSQHIPDKIKIHMTQNSNYLASFTFYYTHAKHKPCQLYKIVRSHGDYLKLYIRMWDGTSTAKALCIIM